MNKRSFLIPMAVALSALAPTAAADAAGPSMPVVMGAQSLVREAPPAVSAGAKFARPGAPLLATPRAVRHLARAGGHSSHSSHASHASHASHVSSSSSSGGSVVTPTVTVTVPVAPAVTVPAAATIVVAVVTSVAKTTGKAKTTGTTNGATTRVGTSTSSSAASSIVTFDVTLTEAQEVPKPKQAKAAAVGTFNGTLIGSSLTWSLTFSGLTGAASGAHIHLGASKNNGTVLVPLCVPCASGASGTVTLNADQLQALLTGKVYVNVHTAINPRGEIRGQLTGS